MIVISIFLLHNIRMKIIHHGIRFNKIIIELITSQAFFIITFFGNSFILIFSYIFYLLEQEANNKITSYLDAVWWAYSTATTVGYGDIIPVTIIGKILGIILMLSGTGLYATYTALIAQTILADEMIRFRKK